eukprot:TRINITY_DN7635_c0_g2_i2.p1 TRINITY_DN7635_c0_g2~~TRINITY_DN7635_c0_g2_i2.p1  ORF type:complete len:212 (+),score=20.35 TRINITY_DN7635_c0_g2_i2:1088-1723(+)
MPLHIALTIPLTKKTCHQIESMMRNFLWSSNSIQRKRNLVSWKTICLPKNECGLGIQRISDVNDGCMLRLGWNAMTTESIWANWLRNIYFKDFSIWYPGNPKSGSFIWRKIRSLAYVFQLSCSWSVGDGTKISIWHDCRMDLSPVAPRFPQLSFSRIDSLSAIISGRRWDIPDFLLPILFTFLQQAHSIQLYEDLSQDELHWAGNSSGSFS